ncbi:MAG: YhfC family intramembrane metalloprotease [Lachnospiraceae bacterium]|nr:YhfC family intramembrane metalloprotease [Lachnospiraceae bacterium]
MVATSSMIVMGCMILFSIAVPVILGIVLWKKYKTAFPVFFIGCATFVLFALILEQILHTIVMASPAGDFLFGNTIATAIYGGLAAGIFEETGRFLAMKKFLKKYYPNPHNALMFGAGHGGIEMIMVYGITMVNNIAYSVMINSGQMESVIAAVPAAQQGQIRSVIDQLIAVQPGTLLAGGFERISAVLLHLAFSVLVWTAVTKGKTMLYPLAILCHALVDGLMVIIAGAGFSTAVLEILIFVMAVAVAVLAFFVWKKILTAEEG